MKILNFIYCTNFFVKTCVLITSISVSSLFICDASDLNQLKSNDDETNGSLEVDVLVYGATPSGIMAAYSVISNGYSVVIVEPSKWVGGILGSGLKPVQDMPNYEAVGGKTRELMLQLGVRSDKRELTVDEVQHLSRREISPKYVREDFLKFLNQNNIRVIYDHRVNRVIKKDKIVTEAIFDLSPFNEFGRPVAEVEEYENLRIKADIFIDASYEGELMARSGVSNRIGREAILDYNEELAGVRPLGNITPISPFIVPDNPDSGLLPMVEGSRANILGAGDHYTQAYNFRYYVTSDPERRVPITPPENFKVLDYELVGRYVEYIRETSKNQNELVQRLRSIFPGWLNSGEYNYQRSSLITMAPLGISHLYAGGDYATKARIWEQHQDYLRGLHYFLSTDDRVPKEFRDEIVGLGLDKFHHPDTNGWPHQLYIRVSRRMVGEYTITAHDVYNRTQIKDPIGLAQYGIDTYPSRRIWFEQNDSIFVATEGNMFVGGAIGPTNVPYPIPYRSITPQKHECSNLLVPILFSSSHLGYASARMEPTFMIVGESAGIAAVHSLDEKVPVQDINMERYLNNLKKIGQYLFWDKVKNHGQ